MNYRRYAAARSTALIIAVTAPTVLLGVLCLAQDSKMHAKEETAGHKYKNIQVFKNLPADQLIPVMHRFNDSLGVKCDFCHVVNPDHTGYEKDDKPTKLTARTMVLMANNINKHQKALSGKATCFMCHHGMAEPELQPAPVQR